jgi:hypothetical protein
MRALAARLPVELREEGSAMGVLTDYFRARDRAAVLAALQDDSSSPLYREAAFDGVALKGIDSVVLLGKLVSAIIGAEWGPELTAAEPIYPPADTKPDNDGWRDLPEDSPWTTGPWVEELGDHVRDALATLPSDRLASVAAEWSGSEEFWGGLNQEAAEEVIVELRALAERSANAGERLYCWTSL